MPQYAKDTAMGRFYKWGDESFVSVTTVLSDGVPKPGLQRWFVNNVIKAAAADRVRLAALTSAEVTDFLKGTITPASSEASAVLGSRVHSKAEIMSRGGDIGVIEDTDRAYVDSLIQFFADFKPNYIEAESSVFSRTYGYAGTLDAVIELNGKRHVLDVKTGKSVWPEVALQLSAYKHADFLGRPDGTTEEMHKTDDTGLVLHIRPEGYELIPVDIGLPTFDTFLSALDMHRWIRVYSKDAIRPAMTPTATS